MATFTPNRYTTQTVSSGKASLATRNADIWKDTVTFWHTMTVPILKSVARVIVQTASKYSPPGKPGKQIGTATIDGKYYYCKIIDLIASAKDPDVKKRPRKEDYQYIREGYKFKIIKDKYRQKKQVIGYAKSLRAAKQMARIKNRGLTKYSWGTLLNNFTGALISEARRKGSNEFVETELPPNFKFLANHSPNITRYRWGSIRIQNEDGNGLKWRMQGRNNCTASNAFEAIAVRQGVEAGVRQWRRSLSAIKTGNINSFQKFLNFEIKKVLLRKK